jgi:N-acetylglutamate synthase-like GNAT family acetyltransferase
METINEIALRFDLDSNDMEASQFIVAEEDGHIAGFGRLWQHNDCLELGTIGVVEEDRGKGLAKKIIRSLLKKTGDKDVYLTTLIPDFFEQFGFKKLDTPPPQSMIRKAAWCEGCKKAGCTVMIKKN